MFITIEGIGGSGKSTLITSLLDRLTDFSPLFTKEPTTSPIGSILRSPSMQEDPIACACLFLADRAHHIRTEISPALQNGRMIICDRYMDSQIAYQSVMLDGVFLDPGVWIKRSHIPWVIIPDLTILLDLPVEDALDRIGFRPALEVYESETHLRKIRQNYLSLYENRGARDWLKIDARNSPDLVADLVEDAIRKKCGRVTRG